MNYKMKIRQALITQMILCTTAVFASGARAMEDLDTGGTAEVFRKITANCRFAERQHAQSPTQESISRLTKAYGETGAAARMAPVLGNKKGIASVARAITEECRLAEIQHKQSPTQESISRLTKSYGATGVVAKILAAIERDKHVAPVQPAPLYYPYCNPWPEGNDNRGPKGDGGGHDKW